MINNYITHGLITGRQPDGQSAINIEQAIRHHSPNGLEYGYNGSGPADLALNVLHKELGLLNYQGPRSGPLWDGQTTFQIVLDHYQEFKNTFIMLLPNSGGQVDRYTIQSWLSSRLTQAVHGYGRFEGNQLIGSLHSHWYTLPAGNTDRISSLREIAHTSIIAWNEYQLQLDSTLKTIDIVSYQFLGKDWYADTAQNISGSQPLEHYQNDQWLNIGYGNSDQALKHSEHEKLIRMANCYFFNGQQLYPEE